MPTDPTDDENTAQGKPLRSNFVKFFMIFFFLFPSSWFAQEKTISANFIII